MSFLSDKIDASSPAQNAPSPTPAPTPAPAPAPTGIVGAAMTPDQTYAAVGNLYRTDLNRAPDQQGLDYWSNQVLSGKSLADVEGQIKASPEYAGLQTAPAPSVGTAPSPATGQTATVTNPTQWNLTPEQTVEGRIQSIVNAGNPLVAQAQAQALEGMNARGLVNSSMAQTAGQAAAYNAALPIAQADAATAAKAASYNADTANKFALNNQDALNKSMLQGMSTDEQTLVQSNSQANSAFNQAMSAMNAINQNEKMDANAKTQAIAQIQNALKTQLGTLQATSGLGLSSQLNFANWNGFDANGNYVGFDANGNTAGTAPAPAAAPVATPAEPWANTQ